MQGWGTFFSTKLYLEKIMSTLRVGLPCLQNLVNVYMSSNNRNDSAYTEVPDLCFFIMQIGKIADIFPKKTSLKMYLVRIFKIV